MTDAALLSDDTETSPDDAGSSPAEPATPATPGFEDLGLPDELLQAVSSLGFTRPSPVQEQTIPLLLQGRDVIGVAQTGTGKTAAFGLPLLAAVDPTQRRVQALVLVPTRELAMQGADAISSFAQDVKDIEVVSVYGGSSYVPQERALRRGAQVVVGTPGRIMDHLRRGTLDLAGVGYTVLDEADEMLRMGFAEDVDEILSHCPEDKQAALFSATMPPAIKKVATDHMHDPVQVSVARQATTVTSVTQRYAVVPYRHKAGALARILATSDAQAAIVFVRTRSAAEEVGTALVAKGLVAATISGDVPQKERERIVGRLRDGSLQVLVATDVAARGLDVERIGLVVNFDVPGEPEAYVHRIGRTGRAGRSGEAITFVAPHERRKLRAIEKTTRQRLEEMKIPSPRDVSAHRTDQLLQQLPGRIERGRLGLYQEKLDEFLATSEFEARDLAAALLATSVGDGGPGSQEEQDEDEFLGATLKGSDREDGARGGDRRGGQGRPGHAEHGYTSYRVGVGHAHGARPAGIVGTITGEGKLPGSAIGKIDIFGFFSLVQVRGTLDEDQMHRIGKATLCGRELRISVDRGPRTGPGGDGKGRGGSYGKRNSGPRGGRDSRDRSGRDRASGKDRFRTKDRSGRD
jgi:ATP-dependent RNA helicase DeaD